MIKMKFGILLEYISLMNLILIYSFQIDIEGREPILDDFVE